MGNAPKWYDSHLAKFRKIAHIKGAEEYEELYRRSLEDIDGFWSEQAREYLSWVREWDSVLRHDVDEARVEWFGGGVLNASYNCLDRHMPALAARVAYHWQGDEPSEQRTVTYGELLGWVNKLAAYFRSVGVDRGDRVVIFMPAVPELPAAMLACARIGAVHCVVHPEYSSHWLAERIRDCGAKAVVATDGGHQAGKRLPVKEKLNEALHRCPEVEIAVVCHRQGVDVPQGPCKEVLWSDIMSDASLPEFSPPEPMASEDPLFVIFAGGNTGKPKGLVHTHAGYLLWAAMTTRLVFDLRDDDVFWCTSDLAWLSGHTLNVYGPLLNGVTAVLHEGAADYPEPDRYWSMVNAYGVTKLSTEPVVITKLAGHGPDWVARHDLSSLKILGSCGQPMSQEVWRWLYDHVGRSTCPIMDSWWQTESGGPMMTPLPGVHALKPGSVAAPFFGVKPIILDLNTGEQTKFPNQEGAFFIGAPWPGMARTVCGDHEGYAESYFAPFERLFITGDGAKIDEDGYYWITGRIDDVINVAGHRIGAWEIETALIAHPEVAEAAVVAFPHPLKGQGLYAFVTLSPAAESSDALKEALKQWLEYKIGPISVPDALQWAEELPKTRSGKILRRLLQRIAAGRVDDLGDTKTVSNPTALFTLIRDRMGVTG